MNIRIIILLLLFVIGSEAYGQKKSEFVTVKGRVLNAIDKSPIQGAIISAAGAKRMGVANKKGEFKINIPTETKQLSVTTVDFYHQTVRLSKDSVINIYLLPLSSPNYSESFALPFREIKTEDHTGTSKLLMAKDFDRGRNTVDDMLVGNVAGVRTLKKSGMPGEGNFVSIRGIRSMTGSNSPILVVDGMPILLSTELSSVFTGLSDNIFKDVSFREIESISILKGADAMPFGAIGSNGIIAVTTDRASDMETSVEFETSNGISMLAKELPLLSGDDYRTFLMQTGQTEYSPRELMNIYPFLNSTPKQGVEHYTYSHNTNWQEEIFSPAFNTENTLKVKGGDAQAKYSMLAGYSMVNGIENNTNSNRYFARINGDMQMTKKLAITANIGFSHYDNSVYEQGYIKEVNPIFAAIQKPSILAPKRVDEFGESQDSWEPLREFGISNPSVLVEEIEGNNAMYNTMVSVGANFTVNPFVTVKGLLGINYDFSREKIFIPGVTQESIAPLESGKARNTIRQGINRSMVYYGNLSAHFNRSFNGGHSLSAMAGTQLYISQHTYEHAKGINTATDYNTLITDAKDAAGRHLSGFDSPWKWSNFFANAVYDYNKQIYVGASLSADVSSISGERSDLFNLYPAANIAWDISNASFMSSQEWLDRLMVRAEFSQKGNAMFSSKLSKYHYVSNEFLGLSGVMRSGIPNAELQPEYVESFNVGIDFKTLGHKLTLTADVYQDVTKDMILPENLESAYGSEYRYVNSGEMESQGFELGINATLINTNDFSWYLGATIAKEKSKINSLGANVDERIITLSDGAEIISRVGDSPYLFYGLQSDGVYITSGEATNSGLVNIQNKGFRGGDMIYIDAYEDNVIDNKDKVVIGDPNPDFFGGFFTSFVYKTFTLSAQFAYSYGNDVYNAVRRVGEGMVDFSGQTEAVKNAWYYEGHQTNMPRAEYGDPMQNSQFSSRWIEDGSYLKLKNLTLNYQHPTKLWLFTNFQAYVTGENLFTLTKYLGYDPEFAYSYDHSMLGVDYGKVPGARTFKLGIRLGF